MFLMDSKQAIAYILLPEAQMRACEGHLSAAGGIMSGLQIRDIEVIATQPRHIPQVVVKVLTSEPGLYGLGCATFSWRWRLVKECIERYFKPILVGKDADAIEDIWHLLMHNSYWRNGPVLNNALGGIDMALWDIKGKRANMPCYQLWGGASRPAAAVYVYANGRDEMAVADKAEALVDKGFRHIRCQLGGYDGVEGNETLRPDGCPAGVCIEPREKLRRIPGLFAHLRRCLGDNAELIYDVHERLAPVDGVWLAKALEEYRLFFLEDLFAPEDLEWFPSVRAQCATPLAMGELATRSLEIEPLVHRRSIDFVRIHPSAYGGITPCLKLAGICESFGVRTAWHNPPDISPVGIAANVHMDIHVHNFGVQEWTFRHELEQEMFPGMPTLKNGCIYLNDAPGLGIDINENLACAYPCTDNVIKWTMTRLPDGTMVRP
jgi:mannonate dehydratase